MLRLSFRLSGLALYAFNRLLMLLIYFFSFFVHANENSILISTNYVAVFKAAFLMAPRNSHY